MRARLLVVVLGLVVSCGASERPQAKTQPTDAGAEANPAKRHFETGVKLYEEHTYPEALAAFEEAYRIGKDPAALQYIALCQRQMKHPGAAFESYSDLLAKHDAELKPEDKRAAQQALEELGAITSAFLVVVNEPDAEISLDKSTWRSPMAKPRRVRAGTHQVRISKAGFAPFEASITLAGQESKKIEVKLEPAKNADAMTDADRKATARAAFAEGVALQDKGDCAGALPKFETAQRLHDAPTHLLHMAQCQAATGKLVASQENLATLAHATLAPGSPDAFQKAQDEAKALLPAVQARVPTLRVQIVPAASGLSDLAIQMNGAKMANDLVGIARPLDPGTYKITASAKGWKPTTLEVRLDEKEAKTAEVRLRRP